MMIMSFINRQDSHEIQESLCQQDKTIISRTNIYRTVVVNRKVTVNRIFIVNWTGNIKTVIQAKTFIVKVPMRNPFVNTYRNASINSTVLIKEQSLLQNCQWKNTSHDDHEFHQ